MSYRSRSVLILTSIWAIGFLAALAVSYLLREYLAIQLGKAMMFVALSVALVFGWFVIPRLFPSQCPECSKQRFICTSWAPLAQGFRCLNCGHSIDVVKKWL
jgi:hypothetical protein